MNLENRRKQLTTKAAQKNKLNEQKRKKLHRKSLTEFGH